ncbi:DNA-binding response OmpR family regulator [Parabacteroides sp. PFB2-12]|uniref:response regulator transcription factor n=1 Tax=unclassified Parabacteroides TaxID=2649774 RepID=UPI0024759468|nr:MULTISPECIES: response regulator transcription factor [unclassified Parabacteroides]MDH6341200.1 DNA-binding response OmpR family regulator [Parabacteroides sp. PM6-13]MDH6389390.1 DNA-binding response OmpR family regulator [Parabacteroides sp. PFB2-12]
MANILLVEDEANISSFIERGLGEFGYAVCVANNGLSGWELLQKESFQLLILDIVMPGMTGIGLCRRFRQAYGFQTPVIMLTALGTTEDIVAGLEAGADDYLVKPFSFQELVARVNAMLRRAGMDITAPLNYADLSLNRETRRATRAGQVIDLTVREYRLLEYLLLHAGEAVSREALIREVWDKEPDRNMNVVDVYVNYLRGKVDKGFRNKLIHTVSGVGYRLEA